MTAGPEADPADRPRPADPADRAADVVVVTGASSGIGAEVADIVASRGARVVLAGRRHDPLAEVASRLRPHPAGPHLAVGCDVSRPEDVERLMARASSEAGVPNALVNCAGVCVPESLAAVTPSSWQETIGTNLTGTMFAIQAFASRLHGTGLTGSVVNLGSEASFMGMPAYATYCASKAALVGLTKALAAELAPEIRVNLLCPGPIDTPMLRAEFDGTGNAEQARTAEIGRIPLGRLGHARETAQAAVWLLWDAVFATGSSVSLDGGTTGAFMGVRA
jgi:NAD(P)-dependent dehydrogenase (short-subunit alcohol dehydrogenase family)